MFERIEIGRCPNCHDAILDRTIKICKICNISIETIKIKKLFVSKVIVKEFKLTNLCNEYYYAIIINGEVGALFNSKLRAYYVMLCQFLEDRKKKK
jgi:hypothetical protein